MSNDYESKWCPMVRMDSELRGSSNSETSEKGPDRNPSWSRCIGPECMMWRSRLMQDHNQSWKQYEYCGLAGRP